MQKQTEVLIIGGGFAGVAAATELHKKGIQTLLVDKKDYFEVAFATLRNVADPEVTGNRARKEYADFLPGDFIQQQVAKLNDNRAELADGTTISFEKAIIATGSRYPTLGLAKSNESMSYAQRNDELSSEHKKLNSANSVLIIGGGIVGVELAGEVAFAHPDKKVILAHGSAQLLDGMAEKAQLKAQQQLSDLGVEIMLNTRLQKEDDVFVDPASGKKVEADVVYQSVGTLPNSEFLQSTMPEVLTSKGLVNVDEQLRVVGKSNLYAMGDVADVGEAKLGYLAVQQGTYLGKSISRALAGKNTKSYKRNPFAALVPVGQKAGVVQLPFAVTSWNLLVNIKQKDLFISKIYKGFNTQPNIT